MSKSKSSRLCIFEDCQKRASFNYKDESKGTYCAQHKLENMVDVLNPKCYYENCITTKYFWNKCIIYNMFIY